MSEELFKRFRFDFVFCIVLYVGYSVVSNSFNILNWLNDGGRLGYGIALALVVLDVIDLLKEKQISIVRFARTLFKSEQEENDCNIA